MSHAESVDSGILDTTVESFDRHYAVNVRSGPTGSLNSRPGVSEHRKTPPTSSGSCSPSKGNAQLLYTNGGYPKGRLPV
jgi:hypothetical protein